MSNFSNKAPSSQFLGRISLLEQQTQHHRFRNLPFFLIYFFAPAFYSKQQQTTETPTTRCRHSIIKPVSRLASVPSYQRLASFCLPVQSSSTDGESTSPYDYPPSSLSKTLSINTAGAAPLDMADIVQRQYR